MPRIARAAAGNLIYHARSSYHVAARQPAQAQAGAGAEDHAQAVDQAVIFLHAPLSAGPVAAAASR